MGTLDWLTYVIQRILNLFQDKMWHLAVNMACKLNEARLDAGLPAFPGQVERIDGNAMTAESRARIERHETEGLASGCLNYLPHIDSHAVAHDRDFIN